MPADPLSYAHLGNLGEIDSLYKAYLKHPDAVDLSWRYFFEGVQLGASFEKKGTNTDALLDAYRRYGYLKAAYNPMALESSAVVEELNSENGKFPHLESGVSDYRIGGKAYSTLREWIDALENIYCRHIGFEYMEVADPQLRQFLKETVENQGLPPLSLQEKRCILTQLLHAERFEAFLHTKYVGKTRFSLEGAETLIPLLVAVINKSASLGVEEMVLGMPHRGRLNVLAHCLHKPYAAIFYEFEENFAPAPFEGSGDVKYHQGYTNVLSTPEGKQLKIRLMANPSHLEAIDPVVEGTSRALWDGLQKKSMSLLMHGDAAISGQGVVYETLQMARLSGYKTGGTLHLIVNNNIGFTTLAQEGRSTLSCCSIARAFGYPVFHVNAEDPIACVQVALLAVEVIERFKCDVFIDLCGYRKYGHNEGDEPLFTQPLEYALIQRKKSIYTLYLETMVAEGLETLEKARQEQELFQAHLQQAFEQADSPHPRIQEQVVWESVDTAVDLDVLKQLGSRCCAVPEGFVLNPKLARLLMERQAMLNTAVPSMNWGMAEQLAFASLLEDQVPIRLSGQDVQRGTFSHRHAVWTDQVTGNLYIPLGQWKAPFSVYNSPLSEYAVLGFDFGYSIAGTNAFVLWEAQFGDFANGAQIIIDQLIAASEQKWGITSNLTLLLPHGYEGQGPEHSSACIERFLQLCAQENMRVALCSTPAQLFHLLRQQALHSVKKPLILFTPKALLRHRLCVSSLNDLAQGTFQTVIDDVARYRQAKKVALCTGKIYYDLLKERTKRDVADVALIRIEQLYPFPQNALERVLKNYQAPLFWVQEEPQNKGAWSFIAQRIQPLSYVGREASASPATGFRFRHQEELSNLLNSLFGPPLL